MLSEELVKEALSLTDFQTEKELIEFALQVWSVARCLACYNIIVN